MNIQYIVFDLEATCWRLRKPPRQEIIEIGATKLNDAGQRVSEFSAFVRPKLNPKLSSFCKELTSIEQYEIDRAQDFEDVMYDFEDWLGGTSSLFLSWGDYDRKQLLMDAEIHEIELPWLRHYLCLKLSHSRLLHLREPVGVSTALEYSGLFFEGTSHRAIEDARNTSRLFEHHFDEWQHELNKVLKDY